MRALSSHIFAGGFSLGVSKHFDIIANLEEDNYGTMTFRHNLPQIPVFVSKDNWPLDELKNIDLIFGNPACAAFSQAGRNAVQGGDWRVDPRLNQTRLHFDLLKKLEPKFWVTESVPRMFTVGRSFVDELTNQALDLGYSATFLLHNARYLGCAQNRPRFFLVFHRLAFDPIVPDWDSERAAGEVLGSMNDIGENDMRLSPDIEALFPRLKPGECLRTLWERENPPDVRILNSRGQVKGRPPFTYHRIRWDRPSNVLAGFYLIHPREDRCLTTREMATLCGFPGTWEWKGSGINNQIARGVCPPVGEWLARSVKRSLERGAPNVRDVTLADYSKPPGRIEEIILDGGTREVEEVEIEKSISFWKRITGLLR